MTSIFIIDTDSSSLMFKKDEITFIQHLDSIADQSIEFNNEQNQILKNQLPVLELKKDVHIIDYW